MELPDRTLASGVSTLAKATPALRIAILAEGGTVRGWEAHILERIAAEDTLSVVAVIETARPPAGDSPASRPPGALWRLADRLDNALCRRLRPIPRPGGRDVDDIVALDALLGADVPRLPAGETASDAEGRRALRADVLLRLGSGPPLPDFPLSGPAHAPRHGVWWLELAAGQEAGAPPGFWEFYTGTPVVTVTLRAAGHGEGRGDDDGDGNEATIRRAHFRTIPWSWNETRRRMQLKAGLLAIDALKGLAVGAQTAPADGSDPLPVDTRPRRGPPGPWTALAALAKAGWRGGVRLARAAAGRKQWRLYVARRRPESAVLNRFTPLVPPRDRFWADPFPIAAQGRLWIFAEECRFADGRGFIAALEVEDGRVRSANTVIEAPHHLSYPYLFTHRDRLFMVPESHRTGTVPLWECVDFPLRWEWRRDLLTGVSAADSSVIEHEGRWWMFTTIDRSGLDEHTDELHLFHTDDPVEGVWHPHPGNPVVTDVRSARMGGGFLRRDGRLYRCAQSGETSYGGGVVIAEVLELTPDRYRECVRTAIRPEWAPSLIGTHHLAAFGGWMVVDALAWTRR